MLSAFFLLFSAFWSVPSALYIFVYIYDLKKLRKSMNFYIFNGTSSDINIKSGVPAVLMVGAYLLNRRKPRPPPSARRILNLGKGARARGATQLKRSAKV